MSFTKQKRVVSGKPLNAQIYAAVVAAIAILAPVLYFASSAPAFKMTANTEGIVSKKTVRKLYRPLFDEIPDMTRVYLELCGVSDLEIFFVMQAEKGESS